MFTLSGSNNTFEDKLERSQLILRFADTNNYILISFYALSSMTTGKTRFYSTRAQTVESSEPSFLIQNILTISISAHVLITVVLLGIGFYAFSKCDVNLTVPYFAGITPVTAGIYLTFCLLSCFLQSFGSTNRIAFTTLALLTFIVAALVVTVEWTSLSCLRPPSSTPVAARSPFCKNFHFTMNVCNWARATSSASGSGGGAEDGAGSIDDEGADLLRLLMTTKSSAATLTGVSTTKSYDSNDNDDEKSVYTVRIMALIVSIVGLLCSIAVLCLISCGIKLGQPVFLAAGRAIIIGQTRNAEVANKNRDLNEKLSAPNPQDEQFYENRKQECLMQYLTSSANKNTSIDKDKVAATINGGAKSPTDVSPTTSSTAKKNELMVKDIQAKNVPKGTPSK